VLTWRDFETIAVYFSGLTDSAIDHGSDPVEDFSFCDRTNETAGEKPKEGGAHAGAREGGRRGGGGRGKSRKVFVYVTTPENRLHAIAVVPGISDGISTVVVPVEAGSLEEGTEVVTAILREEEPATTNPFAPPRMGGGGGGGRGLR
jgi:hypothetical protein